MSTCNPKNQTLVMTTIDGPTSDKLTGVPTLTVRDSLSGQTQVVFAPPTPPTSEEDDTSSSPSRDDDEAFNDALRHRQQMADEMSKDQGPPACS